MLYNPFFVTTDIHRQRLKCTRYRHILLFRGGKCTAFIQRHSLLNYRLWLFGGMGSATKDTASGFQHGDMKRLRDYISKSYAELGLWVAKHLRESTYNVILEGLRSFIGSHQRETAKRQVYGS